MNQETEGKWQKEWEAAQAFEPETGKGKKFFVTFPYPYLNGPLHLGHAFTATRVDVFARFKRMTGHNVLFPFAFHATGEPIVGLAKRVKARDKKQLHVLKESGVPEKDIKKFEDPQHIVAYYKKRILEDARGMGYSVDWRRSFITIDADYKRFIEWQYLTLRDKGFVGKGTHPVVYCMKCESPTGDHDRLEGEGASAEEFVLLKFKLGKAFVVCATLRPETVFGVTNIWVRPKSSLAEVEVTTKKGKENWIVSEAAAEKLKQQLRKVKVLREFKGKELLDEQVENVVTGKKVPILAAEFVDEENASGIVMSVPSHAPFDYIALKDLGKVDEVGLVSLIRVPGYGEHPAVEACEELGVKNQNDSRVEDATKKVYKKEFHEGVLKENCGEYAGMRVADCKEKLSKEFIHKGWADSMHECSEKVVCRCGNRCIVKILENQWFLLYSKEEWKALTRKCLASLKLYPEDVRTAFENTIEWLQDKACARRSGLGTPLPWDKEWIVETLSDSTVYMSFYAIAKTLHEKSVAADKLEPAFFDYVFTGKNKQKALQGVPEEVLEECRKEFLYWYPVDFRNSADELVPNHLTFYLFHHVALFDKQAWPQGIGVNGMLLVEGEKMSKSKGNFFTVKQLLEKYGADVTRMNLMYAAESLAEPDWHHDNAVSMQGWLKRFLDLCGSKTSETRTQLDDWIESRMQSHINAAREAFEETRFRTALQHGFFDAVNDLKWYSRRTTDKGPGFASALKSIALLLAPICPHTAEEAWKSLKGKGLASLASFPEPDSSKKDKQAELGEELLKVLLEDCEQVRRFVKKKPSKLTVFTAPEWKHAVYEQARQTRNPSELVKKAMALEEARKHGKEAQAFVKSLAKKSASLRSEKLGAEQEFKVLKEAKAFLEKELSVSVEVKKAEESEGKEKASNAEPVKPALLFE